MVFVWRGFMTKNNYFFLFERKISNSAVSLLAGLLLIFIPNFSQAVSCDFKNGELNNAICGYVETADISTGGKLTVHISSTTPAFQVKVDRVGSSTESKTQSFSGAVNYSTPVDGSSLNWGSGYTINIPASWKSGLYRLTLSNNAGSSVEYLTVRQKQPGSNAKILILNGDTTKFAYSPIGGKSLYSFNSNGGVKATSVSLDRPVGVGTWTEYVQFISWMNTQGIGYESASMLDMQRLPALLENYDLVIIPDHNEYWSKEMREVWDQYLAKGGNAAILSGNTMWWQIRVEDDQMVCYKSAAADPLYGVDNSRVTVNWYNTPLNRPENTSTGVSFRHSGYHNFQTFYPVGANTTNGKYQVKAAGHWAFTGTSLANGDYFGDAIVGYETDGALFKMVNGKPVVTGLDGTPANFQILGLAPAYAYDSPSYIPDYVPGNYAEHGWSTMGVFQASGGGTVFVAPTIGWPHGLQDSVVSRITLNVINKLKVRTAGSSTTGNTGNTGSSDTGGSSSSGSNDSGSTSNTNSGSTSSSTSGATGNTGSTTSTTTSSTDTSSSGGGGSFTGWAVLYTLLAAGVIAYRRRISAATVLFRKPA